MRDYFNVRWKPIILKILLNYKINKLDILIFDYGDHSKKNKKEKVIKQTLIRKYMINHKVI